MLSQTVEYALRAMVHLASNAPANQTTVQLSEATQVPAAYLSKVLQALVRGGLVKSQRGVGGGVTLAKEPDRITILDVVNAVDPLKRITTCPLGLSTHGVRLCPLHRRLDDALAAAEAAFASTPLTELTADPENPSRPLCESILDNQ